MLVLTTSISVTATRKEALGETGENGKNSKNGDKDLRTNLAQVPFIQYSITFQKQSVLALLDSKNKVNAIHPTFARKLGLSIKPIDVEAQKIDNTLLNTYEMVVLAFLVMDKANQVRFFEKTFLVANVSPEVVLGMFFFTLSNANIDFLD